MHPNSLGRLRFEDDSNLGEYERAVRKLRKYPMKLSLVGDALGPRFLQLAILEGHRAAAAPGLLPGSARRL